MSRLERLRAKRLAEDDRLVCMERAKILVATKARHAHLSRTMRQAAILRDLCEQITPIIGPEDLIVGRMPEVLPTPDDERFIAEHPELFTQPGLPGWLDSMSIYVPEWDRLLDLGLGGLAAEARRRLVAIEGTGERQREFLDAAAQTVEAVALLIRRYAEEARRRAAGGASAERRRELAEIAARCDRVAWEAPASFADALQLLQIVHMVLSCLVGGRDVTPGRLDQYLLRFYRADVEQGMLNRDEAVVLLATFFLRLSQMAGSGTDFDDNIRRSPCRFTHLYVTVGGTDDGGCTAVNELSHAVLDAIGLLGYKEPTLLVRYRVGMERRFAIRVAELIRRRAPVTVYNDEVVIAALVSQGVPLEDARGYAHSACHNVLVPGREAGSGVGGFHNLPRLVLLAMNGGRDLVSGEPAGAATAPADAIDAFDQLWDALRGQVRFLLANARQAWEARWQREYEDACPLLQSCLMRYSIGRALPCWQAAPVSHLNHYLMGLATTVDALVAVRRLVFDEHRMSLRELLAILASDWADHEELRHEILSRLPRYGQDNGEASELASKLGRLWVDEVERASRGMTRLAMWPAFYSHMVHVQAGKETPATPDGRRAGEPLSENVAPSFATRGCSPTSILLAMSALPFARTPSGAASLTLAPSDLEGEAGAERLVALIESYFRIGGLHIQINVVDATTLEEAMESPERYGDLVVRVTGFSAYFTRLSRDVQEDLLRRHGRDGAGAPSASQPRAAFQR